ncbi:hypothetical protein GCM10011588_53350 [Nocardia jinanensis]|uniref:Uncharacterized protein n=1 Tax=Nocardia jinanensis TaxID=382504 RepID=A0A917RV48_9NOCA|nr:hypothetical protein GCM10011588_53350 [Nocardia jinanensis]
METPRTWAYHARSRSGAELPIRMLSILVALIQTSGSGVSGPGRRSRIRARSRDPSLRDGHRAGDNRVGGGLPAGSDDRSGRWLRLAARLLGRRSQGWAAVARAGLRTHARVRSHGMRAVAPSPISRTDPVI